MSERRPARGPLRIPAWAWPLLALPVVAGVGVWTYQAISAAIHVRLQGSLRTFLSADAAALGQWLNGQTALAEVMAADPRVREDIAQLLRTSCSASGAGPTTS
jgi:hypothetical protein